MVINISGLIPTVRGPAEGRVSREFIENATFCFAEPEPPLFFGWSRSHPKGKEAATKDPVHDKQFIKNITFLSQVHILLKTAMLVLLPADYSLDTTIS